MLLGRNKRSEYFHPKDLGYGKRFDVICNDNFVADVKTQRIVLWNQAATDIFGYSPKEALDGMRVEDLVPERFKAQHQGVMACHQKKGRGRVIDRRQRASAVANDGQDGQGNPEWICP